MSPWFEGNIFDVALVRGQHCFMSHIMVILPCPLLLMVTMEIRNPSQDVRDIWQLQVMVDFIDTPCQVEWIDRNNVRVIVVLDN